MSLIKFELIKEDKSGNTYPLSLRILEQSEKLFRRKFGINFGFFTIYIESSSCPELAIDEGSIFIRGHSRHRDNDKVSHHFDSELERDAAYDLILLAFKKLKDYVD